MANEQQDIIDAIIARLKTVTTANGYTSDIGKDVREWDIARDSAEEVGKQSITDVRDNGDVDVTDKDFFEHDMPVEITVHVAGGTAVTQARDIIYDIYRAIGTDPELSSLVNKTSPQNHRVEVDQGERRVSRVVVNIYCKFSTRKWCET